MLRSNIYSPRSKSKNPDQILKESLMESNDVLV